MRPNITKDWLLSVLAHADDSSAGAGGSSLEEVKKEAEARTVTPTVLEGIPTELGRVVRFKREEKGLSRARLAIAAQIIESEIALIETDPLFQPTPRTIFFLADALDLSRERLKILANHTINTSDKTSTRSHLPFAAKSAGTASVSLEEYEAVRALVEVLSDKTCQ